MKFKNLLGYLVMSICFAACNQSTPQKKIPIQEAIKSSTTLQDCLIQTDSTSSDEKHFLASLQKENPDLLLSTKVVRYFSSYDRRLLFNKVIIVDDSLREKGYVYYEFYYFGDIDDVSVNYKYSMGSANTVFGSVYGSGTRDYFHSYTGYGTTAKTLTLFNNGKKIYSTAMSLVDN